MKLGPDHPVFRRGSTTGRIFIILRGEVTVSINYKIY